MKKLISTFVSCAAIIVVHSVFFHRTANSQTGQGSVRLNATYECKKSDRKFKILRCDGENCKVFQVNEYNPKGGIELDMTREHVLYDISTYQCSAPGGKAPGQEQAANQEGTPTRDAQQPKNTTGKVACPASDPDSNGKTAFERSFRGAIRESWEVEPRAGLDGRVTITFETFRVGPAQRYRTYIDPNDARGKTIYPARATFITCTDYNRRIEITKREREFACYANTAGKYSCTIIAAPNTNVKDKTESIAKPG